MATASITRSSTAPSPTICAPGSPWKRSSVGAPRRSSVWCGRPSPQARPAAGTPVPATCAAIWQPTRRRRGGWTPCSRTASSLRLRIPTDCSSRCRPAAAPAPSASRRLYRLVADRLQAGSTADRAALLELAARQVGDDAFADHIVPHGAGRTWSVPWARCAPPSAHQVCLRFHRHAGMAGVRSRVSAIAVAQLADGGIVAARRGDGTLHIWDLGRSAPRPAPALAAPLSASLAALVIDGRPLLVFADPGGLRLWDLAADASPRPGANWRAMSPSTPSPPSSRTGGRSPSRRAPTARCAAGTSSAALHGANRS